MTEAADEQMMCVLTLFETCRAIDECFVVDIASVRRDLFQMVHFVIDLAEAAMQLAERQTFPVLDEEYGGLEKLVMRDCDERWRLLGPKRFVVHVVVEGL